MRKKHEPKMDYGSEDSMHLCESAMRSLLLLLGEQHAIDKWLFVQKMLGCDMFSYTK